MTRQLTDGEIVTSPPTARGDEPGAWLEMFASIGRINGHVEKLAQQGEQREKRRRQHVGNVKYPSVAAGTVQGTTPLVLDLGSPAQGRQWSVRRLLIVDGNNPSGVPSGGTITTNSNTFAAGAAGSVGISQGGSMLGFDLSTLPVAAAASGTVTVLNLAGGTLNYELAEQVNGGMALPVRFPQPIPASSPSVFPQVSVPAIASGAAYALTVYGLTPSANQTPGSGWWYVGAPGAYGPQTAAAPISSLPYSQTFSGEQITILPRDRLFVVISNATPGHQIIARADLVDAEQGAAAVIENL